MSPTTRQARTPTFSRLRKPPKPPPCPPPQAGEGESNAGDAAQAHPGSEAWSLDPAECQQADDARAMSAVGLEEFEHAGLAAARLTSECPRHLVRQMVIARGHDIAIAEGDDRHLGCRPRTDAG